MLKDEVEKKSIKKNYQGEKKTIAIKKYGSDLIGKKT
jgi:hypothetical protein